MCNEEEETVNHLFFECKVSWRIWSLCFVWLRVLSVNHYDAKMYFMKFVPAGMKGVYGT